MEGDMEVREVIEAIMTIAEKAVASSNPQIEATAATLIVTYGLLASGQAIKLLEHISLFVPEASVKMEEVLKKLRAMN